MLKGFYNGLLGRVLTIGRQLDELLVKQASTPKGRPHLYQNGIPSKRKKR